MSAARNGLSVSRRNLLAGVGGLAALWGVSGCGSVASSVTAQTRIRQWNLLAGSDGAVMTDMHEQFMDAFPDEQLVATTFGWGTPFYTKLVMGASGGNAADVATIHLSRLKSLSPTTLMDPYSLSMLADVGLMPEDFPEQVWERCFVDGELYAVPLDTHALVNYYNLDICEEAGVLAGDGTLQETKGVQEYFDLLEAVKEVTGDYGTALDTNAGWRQFWAWYRQQDGEWIFNEDSQEIDRDKALNSIETMYKLAERGLCPRVSDGAQTAATFENGGAGLVQVGNWEITRFRQFEGLNFSMTEIPDFFGNRRTQGDVHSFVLPRHNEWGEGVEAATMDYVGFMLQNSFQWGAGGGHTPAYLPVTESAEYQDLEPNGEYAGVVDNVQFDPDVWFSGSAARLADEANRIFARVYALDYNPEQALDRLISVADDLIALPDPIN